MECGGNDAALVSGKELPGGVRHGSSPGKAVSPLRSATALHIADGPAKDVRGLPRRLTPDTPFFNDIPAYGGQGLAMTVICPVVARRPPRRPGNLLSERL